MGPWWCVEGVEREGILWGVGAPIVFSTIPFTSHPPPPMWSFRGTLWYGLCEWVMCVGVHGISDLKHGSKHIQACVAWPLLLDLALVILHVQEKVTFNGSQDVCSWFILHVQVKVTFNGSQDVCSWFILHVQVKVTFNGSQDVCSWFILHVQEKVTFNSSQDVCPWFILHVQEKVTFNGSQDLCQWFILCAGEFVQIVTDLSIKTGARGSVISWSTLLRPDLFSNGSHSEDKHSRTLTQLTKQWPTVMMHQDNTAYCENQ